MKIISNATLVVQIVDHKTSIKSQCESYTEHRNNTEFYYLHITTDEQIYRDDVFLHNDKVYTAIQVNDEYITARGCYGLAFKRSSCMKINASSNTKLNTHSIDDVLMQHCIDLLGSEHNVQIKYDNTYFEHDLITRHSMYGSLGQHKPNFVQNIKISKK